jgi:hypothetical protein
MGKLYIRKQTDIWEIFFVKLGLCVDSIYQRISCCFIVAVLNASCIAYMLGSLNAFITLIVVRDLCRSFLFFFPLFP